MSKIRENWIRFKERWQLQWYECRANYREATRRIWENSEAIILFSMLAVAILVVFCMFSLLIGETMLGYLATGREHGGCIPNDKLLECIVTGGKVLGKWIGIVIGTILAIKFLPVTLCTAWHLWRKKS
jgi:hypothetical protein